MQEFPISGIEQKRLRQMLQQDVENGFVLFDAGSERIALNPRHLLGWHFLWDARLDATSPDEASEGLTVYFSDREEPAHFGIGGDYKDSGPEENDDEGTQLQRMLCALEMFGEDETMISFVDIDGEEVFLRAAKIAVMRVPLWALEPRLAGADDDDSEPQQVRSTPGATLNNDEKSTTS